MIKNITLLFTISILLISSCSIQKRVYNNGYYIIWNSKHKSLNNSSKELLTEDKAETKNSENEIEQVPTKLEKISKNQIEITTSSFIDQAIKKPIDKDLSQRINKKKHVQHQKNKFNNSLKKIVKKQNERNPDAKINGFGLASFIVGILSVLFLFVGIIGLVFAIISLRQFKNNPDKYSHKWMAIVGLIIGQIVCAICILLSLVLAIFGGIIWLYVGCLFLMAIIASLVIINLPARRFKKI